MNRINATTQYSQLNSIKNEIGILNQKINALTKQIRTFINETPKTHEQGIDLLSEDIRETINTLTANVDVMLGQMLEAQRQLTEANTITIVRPFDVSDINVSVNGNELRFEFKRLPNNIDGAFELVSPETTVHIFYDVKHKSTHSDNPEYKPHVVSKGVLSLKMKTNHENQNVKITSTTFTTEYEFEQDPLLSYYTDYIEMKHPGFFENVLKNVDEIKN